MLGPLRSRRIRARSDYAAVADGRNLYLVAAVLGVGPIDGLSAEVATRWLGVESFDTRALASVFRATSDGALIAATVPLEIGQLTSPTLSGVREVLVLLRDDTKGRVAQIPIILGKAQTTDDGPTSPNPPSSESGLIHTVLAEPNEPLLVETERARTTATVRAVTSRLARLSVEFRLVGENVAAFDSAHDHAQLRRRDNDKLSIDLSLEVLPVSRYSMEVPLKEVAAHSENRSLWDFWLTGEGSGMRIGMELSDLRDPRSAFVYPVSTVTTSSQSWRVTPYYTRGKTLALSVRQVDTRDGVK